MDNNSKVFRSEIVRTDNHPRNNLYDLLNIVPARPIPFQERKTFSCDFVPKIDKIYVPKRKARSRVKTVRDIRTDFENDTYAYLSQAIESQQNYLLKKIRGGWSKNDHTITVAKKILSGAEPVSRPSWQMLINLNPDHNIHPRQYVIFNGQTIQVNGSTGGKTKFICNYDLAKTKLPLQIKTFRRNVKNKKKGRLLNSLAIKFKPGPLGRKQFLDASHQKYNGKIELVDLPKVGLDIQPAYGTCLEPAITQFLSNMCREDGIISEKWAEFAVSVLGNLDNTNPKLLSNEPLTFDLNYACDQRRILMRKDLDSSFVVSKQSNTSTINPNCMLNDNATILPDIEDIMNKIIDAVEISINQENMFNIDNDCKQVTSEVSNTLSNITTSVKDKTKRKYCELDRLDVTVIQLPENSEKESLKNCGNTYCTFGCICNSLKCNYTLSQHCGRIECMFGCKCDFSKYINCMNSLNVKGSNKDLIPGIINIEDEINLRLAKEEQKFHQTVIVTGEKNILLKSEKRSWKSSKKYESFYKNMCLKNVGPKAMPNLIISALKLNCENIEPWCMIHNLYKCFCKGKFTNNVDLRNPETKPEVECLVDKTQSDAPVSQYLRPRIQQNISTSFEDDNAVNTFPDISVRSLEKKRNTPTNSKTSNKRSKVTTVDLTSDNSDNCVDKTYEHSSSSENCNTFEFYYNGTCSRLMAYEGRKYSDDHYKNTNEKIKNMEKHDKRLHERIMNIMETHEKEKKIEEQRAEENHPAVTPVKDIFSRLKTVNLCPEIELETEKVTDKDQVQKRQKEYTSVEAENQNLSIGSVKDKSLLKSQNTDLASEKTFLKFLCDANGEMTNATEKTKPKLLNGENKLVGWLEAHYKMYKKRIDQGCLKTSLTPPRIGKVDLHSWDFILSRYRERKNLFLVSKQEPYRIFMAVHTKSAFFNSCININDIRFADLHKYPQTVKNLLTNATDLKDNFCILRGLAQCWELVGSVAKVTKAAEDTENNDESCDIDQDTQSNSNESSDEKSFSCSDLMDIQLENFNENAPSPTLKYVDNIDSSKWFVMTVENDFTEIRFYKKGFFVKYESIVKAINVARMSAKTVRLSSQKCLDKTNGPQFGVYAIPNTCEYCVFIGPYEMNDSLGIETIKSILDVRKTKRTRGFWINTNKVDNLKVIDNPLSFVTNLKDKATVLLENYNEENHEKSREICEPSEDHITQAKEIEETEVNKVILKKKIVKPIKIRKTNGFYHLATDGIFKKIHPHQMSRVRLQSGSLISNTSNVETVAIQNSSPGTSSSVINFEKFVILSPDKPTENVEDEPRIKISAVYSQRKKSEQSSTKPERGMFILKPEEINRKLSTGQLNPNAVICDQESPAKVNEDLTENSEARSYSITQPLESTTSIKDDVLVISDDDDDDNDDGDDDAAYDDDELSSEVVNNDNDCKNVLIQCSNVSDLGWIWGKQRRNLLSFKVPGGQFSKFYPKNKAFVELNIQLSRIVGPSKPFKLRWEVIDATTDSRGEMNPQAWHLLDKTKLLASEWSDEEDCDKKVDLTL